MPRMSNQSCQCTCQMAAVTAWSHEGQGLLCLILLVSIFIVVIVNASNYDTA